MATAENVVVLKPTRTEAPISGSEKAAMYHTHHMAHFAADLPVTQSGYARAPFESFLTVDTFVHAVLWFSEMTDWRFSGWSSWAPVNWVWVPGRA